MSEMSALYSQWLEKQSTSPLRDYSYVGYHYCEKEPANMSLPLFNVLDYGAPVNSDKSCEKALVETMQAAMDQGGGVIYFPKGRYLFNTDLDNGEQLRDYTPLAFDCNNIILRGESSQENGSVLVMQNRLANPTPERMWTIPFYLQLGQTADDSRTLATVTADAPADSFLLTVNTTENLCEGQWITLNLNNNDPQLIAKEMHPYKLRDDWTAMRDDGILIQERHLIKSIDSTTNTVLLTEPLKCDIQSQWNWVIKPFTVQEEVGVENLRFEGGWHEEFIHHGSDIHDCGWSFLKLQNLSNSWVKNCVFANCNQPLFVNHCSALSVLNVEIAGNLGHTAVHVQNSMGVLSANIDSANSAWHASGVGAQAIGNVFYNIRYGADFCFESHASQPRYNLFDTIVGGLQKGFFGGATFNLPNHMSGLTLWNFQQTAKDKAIDFWNEDEIYCQILPFILVGLHGEKSSIAKEKLAAIESLGAIPSPSSLFIAQLIHRLKAKPQWI